MLLQASDFGAGNAFSVSEYEEKIWLLQLQKPEDIPRKIGAYQLANHVDLVLLNQSIFNLVHSMPDLNARYSFSDEGEVNKYYVQEYESYISSFSLESDIFSYLEELGALIWDAANNPPFSVAVVEHQNDMILVLDFHPILNEISSLEGVLESIKEHYQQLSPSGQALTLSAIERPSVSQRDAARPHELLMRSESSPRHQVANLILNEFRAVLHEPDMGLDEDFFDWGGHSLLATRVIGKLLQSDGIELSFNDFFKSATARALAEQAVLSNPEPLQSSGQQALSEESASLTLAQDFLWQAYSAYDFSPIYNLPFAISFLEQVDESILYQAFQDVLQRHAGLRTKFRTQDGSVIQTVVPIADLKQYKWFWRSDESQGVTLSGEAHYKFDLTCELPLRIRFMHRAGNDPQVLSLLIHHMVIDEWSLNTIMADLSIAYRARANGKAPIFGEPVPAINEFAHLQAKQGVNQSHLDYWVQQLQGYSKSTDMAISEHNQATVDAASTAAKWTELKLGEEAFANLSTFARQYESSLFSVLYTAIALSLHAQNGFEEVVIGTSASGRTDANFFDTVGYFTTMVAHRVQFDEHQSVAGLIKRVTEQINTSMSYADVPINLVQKELGLPIEDGLIFDVYIHIHSNNALNGSLESPDGAIYYEQIPPEKNDSMFGLHFEIMDDISPNGVHSLRIVTTYQVARYSATQVDNILTTLQQTLERICRDDLCDQAITQV